VFVGFSRILLLGILIFKGLTARSLYKQFGVKGLMDQVANTAYATVGKTLFMKQDVYKLSI
jgi:hypothetical protein